ncbi:MAG: isoprenylcysteine carboxylmethyltransferase family protein [Acidobacteriota bacterium]
MSEESAPASGRRPGPGVFIPPPLLFMVTVGAALGIHAKKPWPLPLPRNVEVVGGYVLLFGALVLLFWGIKTFQSARTTINPNRAADALVTNGPFTFSRNPLYVAMVVLCLGLALLIGTWWVVVLLPLPILVVRLWVIASEEAHLRAEFGEDYEAYCRRVRRWI